ncbi:hypothetical protein J2S16_000963, partial [Cytobacillus kochii]|nr:hypothetical protein [Cytobacillus kochii]
MSASQRGLSSDSGGKIEMSASQRGLSSDSGGKI